ncbi:unnamed protein product [Chrysoparadoxa australica]
MAELGDFLVSGGAGEEKEITVDMLDFEYANNCEDVEQLRGMLHVLKSGKEGHFPRLEKHIEERLLAVLPAKERAKVLQMRHVPDSNEVHEARSQLEAWQMGIRSKDESLRKVQVKGSGPVGPAGEAEGAADSIWPEHAPSGRALAPVRGDQQQPKVQPMEQCGGQGRGPSSTAGATAERQRLSGYDFAAWDKYDPDKVIQEEEEADAIKAQEVLTNLDKSRKAQEKSRARREVELNELREKMQLDTLTEVEADYMAERERVKGNECYKAGETEEAFNYYSRSIALGNGKASCHVAYANRAMAAMKLDRLGQAEDDAAEAIALCGSYVKAWSRRGMVRHKRGRYANAVADFTKALELSPGNAELGALLKRSREKLQEVEGDRLGIRERQSPALVAASDGGSQEEPTAMTGASAAFTRIAIAEDSDSEEDSEEEGDVLVNGGVEEQEQPLTRIAIAEDSGSDSDRDEGEQQDEGEQHKESSRQAEVEDSVAALQRACRREEQELLAAAEESNALKLKGNALMAQGDAEGAVEQYRQALARDPRNAAAANNQAHAHLKLKQWREAMSCATIALQLDSGNIKALYRRGTACSNLAKEGSASSEAGQAMADFKAVLAKEPGNQAAQAALEALEEAVSLPAKRGGPSPSARGRQVQVEDGPGGNGSGQVFRKSPKPVMRPKHVQLEIDTSVESEEGQVYRKSPRPAKLPEKHVEIEVCKEGGKGEGPVFRKSPRPAKKHVELEVDTSVSRDEGPVFRKSPRPAKQPEKVVQLEVDTSVARDEGPVFRKSPRPARVPRVQIEVSDVGGKDEGPVFRKSPRPAKKHVQLGVDMSAVKEDGPVFRKSPRPNESPSVDLAAQGMIQEEQRAEEISSGPGEGMWVEQEGQEGGASTDEKRPDGSQGQTTGTTQGGAAEPEVSTGGLTRILIQEEENDEPGLGLGPDESESEREMKAALAKEEGNALLRLGKREEALAAYSRGLELASGLASQELATAIANNRALVHLKLEQFDRCHDDVTRVLQAEPGNSKALYRRACAFLGLAQPKAALEDLKVLLDAAPDNSEAASKRTEALRLLSQQREADAVIKPRPVTVTPAVPDAPPKTLFQLERAWRNLRNHPELFEAYLRMFKASTYRRVFKETCNSEVLSSILLLLRDHMCSASSRKAAIKVLQGISSGDGFAMTMLLLRKEDRVVLEEVFRRLGESGPKSDLESLLTAYKCCCC